MNEKKKQLFFNHSDSGSLEFFIISLPTVLDGYLLKHETKHQELKKTSLENLMDIDDELVRYLIIFKYTISS